jgi:hypothetical protein
VGPRTGDERVRLDIGDGCAKKTTRRDEKCAVMSAVRPKSRSQEDIDEVMGHGYVATMNFLANAAWSTRAAASGLVDVEHDDRLAAGQIC